MTARAVAVRTAGFCALLCAAVLSGCAGTKERELGLAPGESPGDLYADMAAAYYQRGQMDSALDRGLKAVSEDKRNPRAHYVLAIVYQHLGKTDEARSHLAEAVRLDPDNSDYLNASGGLLCLQRKYDEALKEFRRALDNPLYKTPEVALLNSADCAKRAGRSVEAERFLREALTANPNYAPALLAMAKRSYETGAYADARGYMARYSRVGDGTAEALLLASRIETKLGNKAGAKIFADTLRRRYPDSPEVMQL